MHLCSMDLGEIISRYASMMMAFFALVPFHIWILLQSVLFMFCVTLVHPVSFGLHAGSWLHTGYNLRCMVVLTIVPVVMLFVIRFTWW